MQNNPAKKKKEARLYALESHCRMSEPQVHIVAKHQCENEAKEISLFSFHAVLWETTRFEEKKNK